MNYDREIRKQAEQEILKIIEWANNAESLSLKLLSGKTLKMPLPEGSARKKLGAEARLFLSRWIDSGYRLSGIPDLIVRIQTSLKHVRYELISDIDKNKAYFLSMATAQDLHDGLTPIAPDIARFICGPYRNDVCRCRRCGKFYLNNPRRIRKQYCSRICAITKAVDAQREKAQKDRIQMAMKAYDKLSKRKEFDNWKPILARNAGVTIQWLTRAINKGTLPGSPWQAKFIRSGRKPCTNS